MIKKLSRLFATAPDSEPVSDRQEMESDYHYWRTRVLYTTLVGYAGFYLVRKSLSVAIPVIKEEYGVSNQQMGLVLTLFGLTYGVSKFINGFFGDQTNPRYFMAFGLICSAIINVSFGLSGGIIAFGSFWILNGWFQGMGWAPCSKTLVNWFSASERGFKFAIANTSCAVGAASVMFINGYLIRYYGWRYCFYVPAVMAFIIALFILNRHRDRPQSLGLPTVEKFRGEEPDIGDKEGQEGLSYKQVVVQYIFGNPMMWVVCLANFFVYIVRYSVMDWGTTFLTEEKGVDIMQAAWIVGGYELAGLAGMLVGGYTMDRLFKGYGGRTCAISMALCAIFIFLFWKLPIESVAINGLLLWAAGFFIYGPQCLVAVIAVNMVPKQAGAAAVGFTGLFGYASTILSGWGLGAIVDNYGWNTGLFTLVISAFVGMLLFTVLWNSNPHPPGSQAYSNHQNSRKSGSSPESVGKNDIRLTAGPQLRLVRGSPPLAPLPSHQPSDGGAKG